MADISRPEKGNDPTMPEATEAAKPLDEAKKDEQGHHDKQSHHAHPHHHHQPRVIHPASSGTSHLDPGAVFIKP